MSAEMPSGVEKEPIRRIVPANELNSRCVQRCKQVTGAAVKETERKARKQGGLYRWSWVDIFSMWSGRGRYLLKGFFQRSIFRAGLCKKDRGRTGGMCTVHLCQSDVTVCNRTTHIPLLLSGALPPLYLPLTAHLILYKVQVQPAPS